MTNLSKIKQERGFHQKKDYKNSIIARSNKNKAMIALSSVAVGGGVFMGLLVPGLLPVMMAGAPMMAMSTNIAVSSIAGAAVGGAHYALNRREGILRKKSKNLAKGYESKIDALVDSEHYADHTKKAEKHLLKEQFYYEQKKALLEKLERKNAVLMERNRSSALLDRKILKTKSEILSIEKAYDLARGMYKDDLNRLNGKNDFATSYKASTLPQKTGYSNTTFIIPVGPVIDKTNTIYADALNGKGRTLNRMKAKINSIVGRKRNTIKDTDTTAFLPQVDVSLPENADTLSFGDRARRWIIGLTGSSKYFVPNGSNTQKMKDLLNLKTPSLDEEADNYVVDVPLQTFVPTRTIIDKNPINNDIAMTSEQIAIENRKNDIVALFDTADEKSLKYDEFVYQNNYNLPIKGGNTTIKVEFENPEMEITYTIGDYQKSFAKPLFLLTELVEKIHKDGEMGKIKISSSMFDNEGRRVETGLNFDAEIESLKDAVCARNEIYSAMLESLYEAQRIAFNKGILSKASGVDIIKEVCDLAIPNAQKDKNAIINDVKHVLHDNIDQIFWDGQFIENFDWKQRQANQSIDINKVEVVHTM